MSIGQSQRVVFTTLSQNFQSGTRPRPLCLLVWESDTEIRTPPYVGLTLLHLPFLRFTRSGFRFKLLEWWRTTTRHRKSRKSKKNRYSKLHRGHWGRNTSRLTTIGLPMGPWQRIVLLRWSSQDTNKGKKSSVLTPERYGLVKGIQCIDGFVLNLGLHGRRLQTRVSVTWCEILTPEHLGRGSAIY